MSLTEQVSKAQVKNILAKLKAGKTISRAEQAMVAAYEAGTLPDLTLEQVAAHFGLSRPGVLRWKRAMAKAGLPWTTIEGIQKWRDSKEQQATPGDINGVKKQKLEREVRRLDIKIAEDEKRLVPVEQVVEETIRVVATWCAELDALVNDLPGQLAGLTETEIQPKLRSRLELLKLNARASFEHHTASA
jgi:hypothetical protein